MAATISVHDGQYTKDTPIFRVEDREQYLVFEVSQGSEDLRYFLHLSEGLSPDYVRDVAVHFASFAALLSVKAGSLPDVTDEEE